jgi:hypothetical protein
MIRILWRAFDCIFGCWHRNLSRPFTCSGRTYEVCVDCGKQLPYSLETMSLCKENPKYERTDARLSHRTEGYMLQEQSLQAITLHRVS